MSIKHSVNSVFSVVKEPADSGSPGRPGTKRGKWPQDAEMFLEFVLLLISLGLSFFTTEITEGH